MVNLPTPQSRIEELMNAFITRDLSRVVTPQSRIEEFWHHLIEGTNSLPIPQTRVELLLKKIIENDTKETPLARSRIEEFLIAILTGGIDNLPIPRSRSEEYLNYIATNNTVIDEEIEYLAYAGTNITVHNTVEKPIRSAILKGQTRLVDELGNECDYPNKPKATIGAYINPSNGEEIPSDSSCRTTYVKAPKQSFKIRGKNRWKKLAFYDINKLCLKTVDPAFNSYDDYTVDVSLIPNNAEYMRISGSLSPIKNGDEVEPVLEILALDNSSLYITELGCCKMPVLTTTSENLCNNSTLRYDAYLDNNGSISTAYQDIFSEFISINSAKPIYITTWYKTDTLTNYPFYWILEYDKEYKFISKTRNYYHTKPFSLNSLTRHIKIDLGGDLPSQYTSKEEVQLMVSYDYPNQYIPHKTNILTANEDVTLRGIGDVQDTLDCMTGEVIERIGEIVLDGVSTPLYDSHVGGSEALTYRVMTDMIVKDSVTARCLVDTFPSNVGNENGNGTEGVRIIGNRLYLYIYKSRLSQPSQSGVMEYLRSNPIKVLYPSSKESIKTVDLKVVDQDGNLVNQLSAFDSTTHIISGSESDNSLIAIAEVEVPTKLIEALEDVRALSSDVEVLANEVDAAQKQQDENSTMTMSAMTELYEIALMLGGDS